MAIKATQLSQIWSRLILAAECSLPVRVISLVEVFAAPIDELTLARCLTGIDRKPRGKRQEPAGSPEQSGSLGTWSTTCSTSLILMSSQELRGHVHQRIVRVQTLDRPEHGDASGNQRDLGQVELHCLGVIPVRPSWQPARDPDRRTPPLSTTTTRIRGCGKSLSELDFCVGHRV